MNVVTDGGSAARTLEASEVRYRRLFETAQDGILILDGDSGRILDSNPFLGALLGYSADELLGKELWEIGLFQDIEANRAGFRQLQAEGYARYEDLPLETKAGRRASVEFVSNVYRVEGQPVIQCNIRDISDRKRAEDAVRAADRRKDEQLAMLAHELRNPLAPLRNAVEVMQVKGSGDPDVQHARGVVERQVNLLTRLVDDLMDVSRIRLGKINLRTEPVNLTGVVALAVEISRPLIDAGGHHLEVSLPGRPLWVAGDSTRLAQVLSNLLNNAAKYTGSGGSLTLTAEPCGGEAVLRVRDTGVGIAPDMLSHVFEMFAQVPSSVGRSGGGLGIGLTLVRSLVEMHGGRVEARSEGLGCGSEFVVRLPLLEETEAEVERKWSREGPPRSVLVVDDNRDAADSLAELLRLAGHEVRVAYDGPAALEVARVRPPNLVLMDIGMPGMDGLEVARRLRQDLGLMQALLVALTGCDGENDRRRSEEAGFNAHLVKPAQPLDLACLLSRPLDMQRIDADMPDGRQRLVPGPAAEGGVVPEGPPDLVGTRPKTCNTATIATTRATRFPNAKPTNPSQKLTATQGHETPVHDQEGDKSRSIHDVFVTDSAMVPDTDVIEIHLLLPSHQFSALEAVASRSDRTVAALLRRTIGDFLKSHSGEQPAL